MNEINDRSILGTNANEINKCLLSKNKFAIIIVSNLIYGGVVMSEQVNSSSLLSKRTIINGVFVGVILMVASAFLSLGYDYFFGKPENDLTVYDIGTNPLFKSEIKSEDIKITYKGENVDNLYITRYKIQNTGKNAIEPEHYKQNLVINGYWNRIIEFTCTNSNIKSLQDEINSKSIIKEGQIELPPVLLNEDDYYTILFVVENIPENIDLTGRIVGVKNISMVNELEEKNIVKEKMELFKTIGLVLYTVWIAWLFIGLFIEIRKMKQNIK